VCWGGEPKYHLFGIFFYKPQYDDGSHQLQYGLIAEEVAKVYPDLVAYDKDGQPYRFVTSTSFPCC
jgi:Chaperone of endosialidase